MVWIQIKTYVLSGSKPFAKLVDDMSPLARKELINHSEDLGKKQLLVLGFKGVT